MGIQKWHLNCLVLRSVFQSKEAVWEIVGHSVWLVSLKGSSERERWGQIKSQFCHLLATWLSESYLTSLGFVFLLYKTRLIIRSIFYDYCAFLNEIIHAVLDRGKHSINVSHYRPFHPHFCLLHLWTLLSANSVQQSAGCYLGFCFLCRELLCWFWSVLSQII